MAERHRSQDHERETDDFIEDDLGTPGQQGRAQGNLERQVGTRDEEKQAEKGAGKTRVTKSDEAGEGDLGGHHGTGKD
ncbi:hypothetical protein [Pelagovum pacificum]|uniref:Uncharacterized protein n=1 Tax=Pelagovum pacificum TaxID=2588711 RepID=A0A5C5GFY3_9RHOB|nr:hypothetical protein [Pelagovum pacificum]QQA44427.1 hypothetical protein I8N54_07615 [Pelagovum pacificum]TNY32456.1 hypothetical protein FHY64_03960 [Pelagovum pacificum]